MKVLTINRDSYRQYVWAILLLILAVMFLPWLGDTIFNTKGEPREAIVAMSMVNTGNWILPVNFGTDIPYKPPFLAWCIAICSYLTGDFDEMASRLPSVIAFISMAMGLYAWLRRYGRSKSVAFLTTMVLASNIEVWRAVTACRVDMVLTACITGSLLLLFNFVRSGSRGFPWCAVLLMSLAMLTKGPVGIFLPACCAWLYSMTCQREIVWRMTWKLILMCVCAMVVPILWYVAAYQQGGKEFLDLVMEENLGRLTGTMSYESHENPFWYNFQTVATGMLPYTLLGLMCLLTLRKRSSATGIRSNFTFAGRCRELWRKILALDPATLYSLISTVAIFVFYCIPKSKRSVYLLPIYPFLAYFTVLMIEWVVANRRKVMTVYGRIIAVLALVIPALFWSAHFVSLNLKGSAATLLSGVKSHSVTGVEIIVTLLLVILGCYAWRGMAQSGDSSQKEKQLLYPVMTTAALLTYLSSVVLPPLLGAKSDKFMAQEINRLAEKNAGVYMYVEAPMHRYYTIDFYLNDCMKRFDIEMPREGWLVVGDRDQKRLEELYEDEYTFAPIIVSDHKSCDMHQYLRLLRFTRNIDK